MGMFQIRVRVSNPADRSRFFEENFWVDTGALYSFVPESRLSEIGIGPLRARELILADGRRDRRLLGEAVFTISQLDESLTCPVIFCSGGVALSTFGATALENFGVQADPTTQQLRTDRRSHRRFSGVRPAVIRSIALPVHGEPGEFSFKRSSPRSATPF